MANDTLAVISQTGESISFFDVASGKKTSDIPNLIPEPHELCLDHKRNVLYLTHAYRHGWYGSHGEDGHEISIIQCTTRQVVGVIDIQPAKGPHYALLDSTSDILYACVEGGLDGDKANAGGIIAIDLTSKKVIKSVLSGYKSHWFVATPDFNKAYCCNKDGGFISVIDLQEDQGQTVKRIPAPDGNEQPSISVDGRWVYFPSPTMSVGLKEGFTDYAALVIDTTTGEIVHRIPMECQMLATHVTSSNLLLVGLHPPALADGRVLVLSSHEDGYKELASLPVGRGPLTITSDAEGKRAYVAGVLPGTVTVVDLEALKVVRTLDVDGVKRSDKGMHCGAHGMAII